MLSSIFSSCEVDSKAESMTLQSNTEETKKGFLTNGNWILVNLRLGDSSIFNQEDIIYVFKGDGTGMITECSRRCDPVMLSKRPLKWSLSSDGLLLSLNQIYFHNVLELTDYSLVYSKFNLVTQHEEFFEFVKQN